MDRRQRPSHGYRAVHIIAFLEGKPVEIQLRTTLQHLWAEFSEKLSDLVDPAIKYGGGADDWRSALGGTSALIASEEELEHELAVMESENAAVSEKSARLREHLRFTLTRLDGIPHTPNNVPVRHELERSEAELAALEIQIVDTREAIRLGKEQLVRLKEETALVLRGAIANPITGIGDL